MTGPSQSAIRTIAVTGSTNADLAALARAGAQEGSWVRADRQTAGRGRQGRAWTSPPGNLHASTLVRLRSADPAPATLALVAAVALEEALSVYLPGMPELSLKWPNDILLSGAKLAGILLEREGDVIVVGMGANLRHRPELPDRGTTSLAEHGGTVEPDEAVVTLAEGFARWLGRWRGEGVAPVRARWLERAHPIGTPLCARLPDGLVIEGLFDGLDADGALILRLAAGDRRAIHAGDVFLL